MTSAELLQRMVACNAGQARTLEQIANAAHELHEAHLSSSPIAVYHAKVTLADAHAAHATALYDNASVQFEMATQLDLFPAKSD